MHPETKPVADREPDAGFIRLQRLRVLVKLMCGIALLAIVYVFFSTGVSRHEQSDALPSLRVDTHQIEPGEMRQLLWENRPVIILHRSVQQIAALGEHVSLLADANSDSSQQPEYALNEYRSLSPQWFVALGSGTDMGCSLNYLDRGVQLARGQLQGAFQDSCRGSYYDLAGRVLASQQAVQNLIIPRYQLGEGMIILGTDQQVVLD